MEDVKVVDHKKMFVARQIAKNSISFGLLLTVLGIFAILSPVFTGVAITALIGILLLASGIIEIVYSFKSDAFGKGILKFVFGILSLIAGFIFLFTPVESLGFLTIMLVVFFLAGGLVIIIQSFQIKSDENWLWLFFSGAVTFLFGILLLLNWPASGIWAIGLYAGIIIVMQGFLFIALGRSGQDELANFEDKRVEKLEKQVVENVQTIQELQTLIAEQAVLMLAIANELKNKVSSSEVDPAITELNKDLGEAREWIKETKTDTLKKINEVEKEANVVFDKMKIKAQDVTKDLKTLFNIK